LVPWLDLAGHSHRTPLLRPDDSGFRHQGQPVKAGESVTMGYTQAPSLDFLVTYGFVDESGENPNEAINILAYSTAQPQRPGSHPCSQLARPPNGRDPPKHLQQLSFSLTMQDVSQEVFPPQLLLCAAAASIPPGKPLQPWEVLGEALQARARGALSAALSAMLGAHSSTMAEDDEVLDEAEGRLRVAVLYRYARKQILSRAVQALGKPDQTAARRLHLTSQHSQAKGEAEALTLRARWQEVVGNASAAEHAWRAAVEADPSRADALTSLGLVQLHTGRPALAMWTFRKARRLLSVETQPEAWARVSCNLGDAVMGTGKGLEATEIYQAALQADSSLEACRENLERALRASQSEATVDAGSGPLGNHKGISQNEQNAGPHRQRCNTRTVAQHSSMDRTETSLFRKWPRRTQP